jgi:citronellol/citronellal dehydrogenase
MSDTLTFGFTDAELASRPISYREGLMRGQTVIVTGGGSGLGKAIAWMFGRLGARIVICGRKPERLDEAAKPMRSAGIDVLALPCNIRDVEAVERFFEAVKAETDGFDILVNNAGGQFPQSAIDFTPKGWNAVIDTNLNGTWWMMQAAAKAWRKTNHSGSIVNIVTVVVRAMPGVAHTAAARSGVIGLSKTLAVEWAEHNIRVNCVAPGAIDTEGQHSYSEEARKSYLRSNPMLRFGDAFDVAEACVYLGGPSGKFVNGETIIVDGGGHLWGEFWAIPKPDYFR